MLDPDCSRDHVLNNVVMVLITNIVHDVQEHCRNMAINIKGHRDLLPMRSWPYVARCEIRPSANMTWYGGANGQACDDAPPLAIQQVPFNSRL